MTALASRSPAANPTTARTAAPTIRCAIYTRKSSEEGLDQAFNSLHAQRESGEAYVASMKHEGWVTLPDQYDDGGFTGGNMERPGVKRLMADIEAGKVDCVVVYKVDRLSRSLLDFARMMAVFEARHVSFVSVTQQFNTTQSMGRLTLNILLSFAQFEREIISERTRDKIAASKKKGKWFGGKPILGYDLVPQPAGGSKLAVNAAEAVIVRGVFAEYLKIQSPTRIAVSLNAKGTPTKRWTTRSGKVVGGHRWNKKCVLALLNNPAYMGKIRHRQELYAGEHEGIIPEATWQEVQRTLKHNGRTGGAHVRNQHGALLKGLIHCGPCSKSMGHTYSTKDGKAAYRYYVCYTAQKEGWDACPSGSLPAEQIEQLVVERIKHIGSDPALVAATHRQLQSGVRQELALAERDEATAAREIRALEAQIRKVAPEAATNAHAAARLAELHDRLAAATERARGVRANVARLEANVVSRDVVATALRDFDAVWGTLCPREQAEVLGHLIKRVDYDGVKKSVAITFHPAGLRSLGQAPFGTEESV